MKYNTATPYAAVYVLIRNEQGKFAFVLRYNTDWMNGHYGLPSGKIEKGESVLDAACREANEELGIRIKPEHLSFVHVVDRHDEIDWVDFYFEAKSWDGEPYNAEPDVHSELAWFDPDALPKNTIPSVTVALGHIKLGESFSEFGWS